MAEMLKPKCMDSECEILLLPHAGIRADGFEVRVQDSGYIARRLKDFH